MSLNVRLHLIYIFLIRKCIYFLNMFSYFALDVSTERSRLIWGYLFWKLFVVYLTFRWKGVQISPGSSTSEFSVSNVVSLCSAAPNASLLPFYIWNYICKLIFWTCKFLSCTCILKLRAFDIRLRYIHSLLWWLHHFWACHLYPCVSAAALMVMLGVLDFLFVNHACHTIITKGASVQLVFGFEVSNTLSLLLVLSEILPNKCH